METIKISVITEISVNDRDEFESNQSYSINMSVEEFKKKCEVKLEYCDKVGNKIVDESGLKISTPEGYSYHSYSGNYECTSSIGLFMNTIVMIAIKLTSTKSSS